MQTHEILTEQLLAPSQAMAHPAMRGPSGRKSHVAKFYRLISLGSLAVDRRRVRLESVRLPSGTWTSAEAIARFVVALNTRAPEMEQHNCTSNVTVERALDRAGL